MIQLILSSDEKIGDLIHAGNTRWGGGATSLAFFHLHIIVFTTAVQDASRAYL